MSDDFAPRNGARHRIRPVAELLVALRFLTRLPVPFVRTLDAPPLDAAMTMFPLAGAIIGALTGTVLILAGFAGLPELLTASLAIAVGLIITGALHEDGLSDMVDGFGGGHTREQRLDIMRDSRIGAYGALALGLLLMARASLYMSFLELPPWGAIILIASAAAFSRALMVDLLWATRPARADGLSVLAGRPTRARTLVALAVGGNRRGSGRRLCTGARRGRRRPHCGGAESCHGSCPRHAQGRGTDRRCLRSRPGPVGAGHAGRLRRSNFFTIFVDVNLPFTLP